MEENNYKENTMPDAKRKSSIKWKVYLILLLILLGFGIYGYSWYLETNELRLEAQIVVDSAKKFGILENAVDAEMDRCEKFIAQKEGDFGSFEYCRKFIDWADKLPVSQ